MPTVDDMNLLLVSAWNDSGGGYLGRLLDGHSAFCCWPFEMQLGTELVHDGFHGWFHNKYRWPVFRQPEQSRESYFDQIIDDELKGRLQRTPTDKFLEFEIDVSLQNWRKRFEEIRCGRKERREILSAYIRSFFEVWKQGKSVCREQLVVGHCPVIAVDADAVFADFPNTRFLHVVRCPFAGYYDMRLRRPQVDAAQYGAKWTLVNGVAAWGCRKWPDRFRIVLLSDLLGALESTIRGITEFLEVPMESVLMSPTWSGKAMQFPGPFGGMQSTTVADEESKAESIPMADRECLRLHTFGVRSLLGIGQDVTPVDYQMK